MAKDRFDVGGAGSRKHQANLRALDPLFRQRVVQVLDQLIDLGWQPIVASGVRTEAEQRELFEKGVGGSKSWHVPGTVENKYVNGVAYSTYAQAADIVDRRYAWGGPAADKTFAFWRDLGRIAKQAGLEWGGDWVDGENPRDVAHVQLKTIRMDQDVRGMRA